MTWANGSDFQEPNHVVWVHQEQNGIKIRQRCINTKQNTKASYQSNRWKPMRSLTGTKEVRYDQGTCAGESWVEVEVAGTAVDSSGIPKHMGIPWRTVLQSV